ncbi:hypothetical protein GOBAR_AA27971 [Gossypium barbadense]|uniref:Uncharacterized protein n=1 Tax=Gossypium barbadense TaxID=3634 RepID=A0A2P5WNM4_GOSBA|nr:hypothetical protein GOBAR_AA27971 [Gossypium barbadense]
MSFCEPNQDHTFDQDASHENLRFRRRVLFPACIPRTSGSCPYLTGWPALRHARSSPYVPTITIRTTSPFVTAAYDVDGAVGHGVEESVANLLVAIANRPAFATSICVPNKTTRGKVSNYAVEFCLALLLPSIKPRYKDAPAF